MFSILTTVIVVSVAVKCLGIKKSRRRSYTRTLLSNTIKETIRVCVLPPSFVTLNFKNL